MDLEDALAQTKAAMLRAEAEGFDNTADALRKLVAEIERLRAHGVGKRLQPQESATSNAVTRLQ